MTKKNVRAQNNSRSMDNIRPKWPFVGTNFPFLAILASQVRVRVRVVTIFIIVVDASPLFTRLHVRFYLMKQSLTHPRRPRGSQSGRKRRDESLQVRGKEPLGTDSHRTISTKKKRMPAPHWAQKIFIRPNYYYYCEKQVCMRCTVTQFARESVGLRSFRGSHVREIEFTQ